MQGYQPLIASDPLVDALLLISDTEDLESLSRKPGFCPMYNLVRLCIEDGLPPPRNFSDVPAFLSELEPQWKFYKRMRLEVCTESLMPWSTISRQEGSLDGK